MSRYAIIAAILVLVLAGAIAAQGPPDPPPSQPVAEPVPDPAGQDQPDSGEARHIGDPYGAYKADAYEQSLQGFVDQQVERPEDPALALNIASVHYQMKNYEEAETGFRSVALAGDQNLRQQAIYSLGNCAYRKGELQEAVELFKSALALNPDDEDAKFNLEFVRDEIRRRHEEAQKRKEEQEQQQCENGEQQQQQQQQQGDQPQDSDRDGLPDETERSGENPTDPHDADSDDDGLLDGQEDQNRSGGVDDGETDPNNPDSDGNGVSDGEQATQDQEEQEPQEQQGEGEPEQPEGLSEEEAERYLQSLEEGQPENRHPQQRGKPRRPSKDW